MLYLVKQVLGFQIKQHKSHIIVFNDTILTLLYLVTQVSCYHINFSDTNLNMVLYTETRVLCCYI